MNKILVISLFILIVFFLSFEEGNKDFQKPVSEEIDSEITVMTVGDIMLDRGVEQMVRNHGKGDFRFPFLLIFDYLNEADILFGNLESMISNKGTKVGSIYSFRADPAFVEGLVFSGFDVISVANNHAFDYGIEAFEDCLNRLRKNGISYIGGGVNENEMRKGVLKEVKGTKIGFLAYTSVGSENWQATEERAGIGWLDEGIKIDIEKMKQVSDIVLVSMHFGREYEKKQNEEQEYFAKMAVDSGADLVIGHHPHVIQPLEKYNEGWIAYSLGNFVFDQYFSEETMEGMLLEITIKGGKIQKVEENQFKISNLYQPFFNN